LGTFLKIYFIFFKYDDLRSIVVPFITIFGSPRTRGILLSLLICGFPGVALLPRP